MKHVFIIAEAGVNHNGSIDLAKKLVDAAVEAGADAIKFQTFKAENVVCQGAEKADYQKDTTGASENQYQMLKKLELSNEEFQELARYCKEREMGFLSTPFDMESIDFLSGFSMKFWKIPSGEITNLPYLEKIGATGKKVIMSTGMSDMSEILTAVSVLEKAGTNDITLLHCNTQYPTPYEDVNLLAMEEIAERTGKKVGYSDHTMGIEVPVAAVALGATVIEKHFTLSRQMQGPDHKASLEPEELADMVKAIRNIEQARGKRGKGPTPSEIGNRQIARRSIVAGREIKKGELFTENNLSTKRPGNGISPMEWHNVIGARANRDYGFDEQIDACVLETL